MKWIPLCAAYVCLLTGCSKPGRVERHVAIVPRGAVLGASGTSASADDGYPQLVVVNRHGVLLYESADGDVHTGELADFGEVFVACRQQGSRVLVGADERAADGVVDRGWMEVDHLIRRVTPVTIGEAAEAGLVSKTLVGRLTPTYGSPEACPLKVIVGPGVDLYGMPESRGAPTVRNVTGTFLFVYDVRTADGKKSYLVGSASRLVDHASSRAPSSGHVTARLLGWIDEEHVALWPSNLTLEYNPGVEAVEERYAPGPDKQPAAGRSSPGTVRKANGSRDPIIAREPLVDFWGHRFGASRQGQAVIGWFDREGVSPGVTRFHVVDTVDGRREQAVKVAFLGTRGSSIAPALVDDFFHQVDCLVTRAGFVDIAIVVGCDARVGQRAAAYVDGMIDLVRTWCERARQHRDSGSIMSMGKRSLRLTPELDMRISVVGFQRRGGPRGRGAKGPGRPGFGVWSFVESLRLEDLRSRTVPLADALKACAQGDANAVSEGLYSTLTDPYLWRPESRCRIIVVIAASPEGRSNESKPDITRAHTRWCDEAIGPGADDVIRFYNPMTTSIYGVDVANSGGGGFSGCLDGLVRHTLEDDGQNDVRVVRGAGFGSDSAVRDAFADRLPDPIARHLNLTVSRLQRAAELLDPKRSNFADSLWESRRATFPIALLDATADMSSSGTQVAITALPGEVCLSEGWVLTRQPEHTHETFRHCVLVARDDIDPLEGLMTGVAEHIQEAFGPRPVAPPPSPDPRMAVASIVVRALADLAGEGSRVAGRDQLEAQVARLLTLVSDNPMASLRALRGLEEAMPVSEHSLLGMPVAQMLEMTPAELLAEAGDLHRKARCLQRIMKEETVPLHPSNIDRHIPTSKSWVFVHPVSADEYVYLPTVYLP